MFKRYLSSLSLSDVALIVFCLAAVLFLLRNNQCDSRIVRIYKDDALFGTYNLSKSQEIVIDKHNRVEIKDAKARISFSDCPDKRCVKQGFNSNMPIICLPNHLILEFGDETDEPKLILH